MWAAHRLYREYTEPLDIQGIAVYNSQPIVTHCDHTVPARELKPADGPADRIEDVPILSLVYARNAWQESRNPEPLLTVDHDTANCRPHVR